MTITTDHHRSDYTEAPRQAAEGLEQRRLQQDRADHRAGVRAPRRRRRRMPGTPRPRRRHRHGDVALAAARRGAVVRGIDYVPELLDIARRRADAEDLDIEFEQADAEKLPYGDGSFDTVFSAIGVMFAADHARAAGELVRVARHGGRIALASWTPEGFVGGMLAAVGRHVSPPPGAQPATRWGVESVVADCSATASST